MGNDKQLKRYLKRARKIFEKFDPAESDFNIDRWLCLMDQLGDVHEWTDYKRNKFLQKKLKGAARTWFNQQDGFRFSWAELKDNLKEAFPRQRDYAVCLERMVGRRKMADEPMTRYFYEKLALCERVGFAGEKAVACIIRGLPEEVQSDASACACNTPEDLYSQFLAGLEIYWSPKPKRPVGNSEFNSTVVKTSPEIEEKGKEEYNDHMSKDCPKPKSEICSHCSKEGHFFDTCPNRDRRRVELTDPDENDGSVKMKVLNKPLNIKTSFDDVSSFPANPSPPRQVITPDRVEESIIPKIDISNSAAESLTRLKLQPDRTSKPPISLDDLKTLEEDVQNKINEASLNETTLQELTSGQINRADVLLKLPPEQKRDDVESINTTLENMLSLRKQVTFDWIPGKLKQKESENYTLNPTKRMETTPSTSWIPEKTKSKKKENSTFSTNKAGPSAFLQKQELKFSQLANMLPNVLKETDNIFGNFLSHNADQLLEGKEKKERRNFLAERDENKSSDTDIKKRDRNLLASKDDSNGEKKVNIDIKKKEKSNLSKDKMRKAKGGRKSGGKELDTGKKETHHQTKEQNKMKDGKGSKDNKGKTKDDSTTLIAKLPPDVLQNILAPETTQLIKNVVNQLKQNTEKIDVKEKSLPQSIPAENLMQNDFGSEYAREDFTEDNFSPSNMPDYTSFQSQSSPMMQVRPDLESPPPSLNTHMNHPNQTFIPAVKDGFNDNFAPKRPSTPMPQPNLNSPSTSYNIKPFDYYLTNASISSNCGTPLLSPNTPAFHNEQKPANFGMVLNDPRRHNEDTRWKQEDGHFSLVRRNQDLRLKRAPTTYREYREMKDSRDPTVTFKDTRESEVPRAIPKDPRENRETAALGENKDFRERDPRLNKDRDKRNFDHDKSTARKIHQEAKDDRLSRRDPRNDRMHSRNTDKSRSRTRSKSYSKDKFISPLDSLYSGKGEQRAGKGYGIQNFRIPKINKENKKEQCTKVSNMNEDAGAGDVPNINNGNRNDVMNNELAGDDIKVKDDKQDLAEQKEIKVEDHEEKTNGTKVEQDKNNLEPPKILNETKEKVVEDAKSVPVPQPVEPNQAIPADENILAQFFANLLESKDKKDTKTALYSLITTFSDSFGAKELSKITKIIKPDDKEDSEGEEEDDKSHKNPPIESTKVPEKEIDADEECAVNATKRKFRRIRKISSTTSSKNEDTKEEEVSKPPEPPEIPKAEEGNVVVPEGTRIKSRKRTSVTPPTPRKKSKTELDKLHDDIQNIFIHDEVVTVTGKRSCRLLKDDRNALTIPESSSCSAEPINIRKTPDPKPEQGSISSQMKAMKSFQILIPKISYSSIKENNESSRRTAESNDEDGSTQLDEGPALGEESFREETNVESTDIEKNRLLSTGNYNKKKVTGRKRGKRRSFGNTSNKKKKLSSVDEPTGEFETKDTSAMQPLDTSFIELDKNYHMDFVTNKPYKCRLCDYQGRLITIHYKTQHPDSEVLISRFSPAVAQEAVEDSKRNLTKYEEIVKKKGGRKYNFTCRFCSFNSTEHPTIFYDHITRHTGEYRHVCPMCDFSASNGKAFKSHMLTAHNNVDRRVPRKTYSQTVLFAYMCGECNYVQLTEKNVEDHINIFHLQKPTIYKINMSTTMDPQVIQMAESAPVTDEDTKRDEEPPISTKGKKNKVHQEEKAMSPPEPKRRMKAAPKCVKDKIKSQQALAKMDEETKGDEAPSIATKEKKNEVDQEEKAISPPEPKKRMKAAPKCVQDKIKSQQALTKTYEETKYDEESPIATNKKEKKVNQEEKAMLPPESKKRVKASPKRVKGKIKSQQTVAKTGKDTCDTSNFASNSSIGLESEKLDIPEEKSKKLGPISKRRLTRELSMSSEEDLIITGRSRRAAKDKATEKLKFLMEVSENGSRKKSVSSSGDAKKTKKEEPKREDDYNDTKHKGQELDRSTKRTLKKKQIPRIKKEAEDDVLTCVTDTQEENKEQLQLNNDLNKSVLSRPLNSVDMLCNRPHKNDIVKQEPKDDLTDSQFPLNTLTTSPVMPVLEKNLPIQLNEPIITKSLIIPSASKNPLPQSEDMQISNSNIDVIQKNDKLITDMIQKLKGKLGTNLDDIPDHPTIHADYNSERPPLLSNVKPTDRSTRTLLIGGLVKVIKYPSHLLFSCLVPACLFSSVDKEAFQKHCSEPHKQQERSSLCEICGSEIVANTEFTLLENIFKHIVQDHQDFMNNDSETVKEELFKAPVKLRIRKLSGDLLSVKQDWEEAIDGERSNKGPVEKDAPLISEVTVSVTETLEEPPPSVAELEMSDENPFPFKISAVMSLAEVVPPLMPIAKIPLRVTSTRQPVKNVITVPRNVSGQSKFKKEPLTVRVNPKAGNYGITQKTTLKVVTTLAQNTAKGVLLPSSKSVINHALTVVNANSVTTSQFLILPTVTSVNALSGMVCSTGKTFKASSSAPTTLTMVPTLQKVTIDQTQKNTLVQEDRRKNSEDADLTIQHVEHFTITTDNSRVTDESNICEADPLSLDKSADDDGDESEGKELYKGAEEAKTGLMSYQLYRCAFCDASFSNSADFKIHLTNSVTCRMPLNRYQCVHCGKQTKSPQMLVNHIQCHGVLRFTCPFCEVKFATSARITSHVKNQHNATNVTVPPPNPGKPNIDMDG